MSMMEYACEIFFLKLGKMKNILPQRLKASRQAYIL
jgi:hypothetical protein